MFFNSRFENLKLNKKNIKSTILSNTTKPQLSNPIIVIIELNNQIFPVQRMGNNVHFHISNRKFKRLNYVTNP